ncbi:hypothetical protein D3C86_1261650 [compost metagenome]
MLEAAIFGFRQFMHQPVGPVFHQRPEIRPVDMFGEDDERQHRRGTVDLARRQATLDLPAIPCHEVVQCLLVVGGERPAQETVQAHTHFPVPVIELDLAVGTAADQTFLNAFEAAEGGGDIVDRRPESVFFHAWLVHLSIPPRSRRVAPRRPMRGRRCRR